MIFGRKNPFDIKRSIRAIKNFPKKGIIFRDITPLLMDSRKFNFCIEEFSRKIDKKIDYVISIESRGFILGSALAYNLKAGFVPIRKKGKLPYKTHGASYDLEYGTAHIEIHRDALKRGSRVVVVDDVLATGGTMCAALDLIQKFKCKVEGVYFLIELPALRGRSRLERYPVHSLVSY